ncbi:MAG: SCO family protein [Mucilaginibacter sp.]
MSKFRLLKKIIILGLILALPGFLYYLLTAKGKNRYKPLPIYGPKQVAKTGHKVHGQFIPDTIFHKLADFNLTDQYGKPVSLASFDKKIVVYNFFYTNGGEQSNKINSAADSLAAIYSRNKMVYFVSVSVDPERDKGTALKSYADENTPVYAQRLFLTGDTTTIYKFARKGLLVDALQLGKNNFIYSNQLILVDSDKRIRGYYSSVMTDDITRITDEIKVLITEELRKNDKPLY